MSTASVTPNYTPIMALIMLTAYLGVGVEFVCVFLGELWGVTVLESVLYAVVGACLAPVFWGLYVDGASVLLRGWIRWFVESGVLYVAIEAGRATIARSLDKALVTSRLWRWFTPRLSTYGCAQLGSALALALVYYLPGWSVTLHSAVWGTFGVPASLWLAANPGAAARFRLSTITATCACLSLVFIISINYSHPTNCDDVFETCEPPSVSDGRPSELPALGESNDTEYVAEVAAETVEEPLMAPNAPTTSGAPEILLATAAETLEPSIQTPLLPPPLGEGAGDESAGGSSDNESVYEDAEDEWEEEEKEDEDDRAEDPEEKSESKADGEPREDDKHPEDEPATSPGVIVSSPPTESTGDSDEASDEHLHHVRLATTDPKEQVPAAISTGEPVLPTCPPLDAPLAAETLAVSSGVMKPTLDKDAGWTTDDAGAEEQVVMLETAVAAEEVEVGLGVALDVPIPMVAPADAPSPAEESPKSLPANPLDISEEENFAVLPPTLDNPSEDTIVEPQAEILDETAVTVPTPVPTDEETFVGALKPTIPPAHPAVNEERDILLAPECNESSDSENVHGAPGDTAGSQAGVPADDPLPAPTAAEARAQNLAVCMAADPEVLGYSMDPQPAGVDNPSHTLGVNPPADPAEEVVATLGATIELDWQHADADADAHAHGVNVITEPNVTGATNQEQVGGSSTAAEDNVGHMPEGTSNEELPEVWGHVSAFAHQGGAEIGTMESGAPVPVMEVPGNISIGEQLLQTVAEQMVGPEIPPLSSSLAPAPAVVPDVDVAVASPVLVASEPMDIPMASPMLESTPGNVYPFAVPNISQPLDAVPATPDMEMAPPPRRSAFADPPRLRRYDPSSYLGYYKTRAHVTVLKKAIRPSFLPLGIPVPPVPAPSSAPQKPGRASAFHNVPPPRPYDPSSLALYYRNRAWVTATKRECRRLFPGWEVPGFVPEFVIPAVPVSWTCSLAQTAQAA